MIRVVTTQVDGNGVLTVPLDKEDANKHVRVTVESMESPADREAWLRFIARTAGSITDPTFVRHPQGEYEKRDSLP